MKDDVQQVEKVSDIIKVLRAGIDFYQDAKGEVHNARIETFFDHIVDEKRSAINSLQSFAVAEKGSKETGESVAVNMRKLYTDIAAKLSSNKAHTYVSQLEEVEDKILEVIDEALNESQPAACEQELRRVRASMQACHDEMKDLQESTH